MNNTLFNSGYKKTRTQKFLKVINIAIMMTFLFNMTALQGLLLAYPVKAEAATRNSAANLDQCRNGSASNPNDCLDLGGSEGWVNGNAGSSQAHYVEGYSIPYRVVMTELPTDGTPITIELGYDIKHSGKHAIDYLTYYDRLEPHDIFGHPAETVDPTSGVTGISGSANTFPIREPSSVGSPVPGMPGNSFNALPAAERVMSIWNGTITDIQYGTQGDLSSTGNSETTINITFTASNPTALLAWGGHIASRLDWGDGNSAGGISGSPYHMRLKDWNLGNLGNQDRSLSAGAVLPAPEPGVEKTNDPNGATNRDSDITYTITYGNTGNAPATFDIEDNWSFGSDQVVDYVPGSVTNAYGGVVPVVDTNAQTITWSDVTVPAYTSGLTVTYQLHTHATNPTSGTFYIYNDASLIGNETYTAQTTENYVSYDCNLTIQKSVSQQSASMGDTLTYTIEYDNTGSGGCTDVAVYDQLDSNLTYVGGTLDGQEMNGNGDGIALPGNFNGVDPLATAALVIPGESGVITFDATVNNDLNCGNNEITNQSSVSSTQQSETWSNTTSTEIYVPCSLTVIKHVVGGTAVASEWTMDITGPETHSFAGAEAPGTTVDLSNTGNYNVAESGGPIGYALTYSGDCDSNGDVTINAGDEKTCTLTNTRDTGTILVNKEVDTNGDGTFEGGNAEANALGFVWGIDSETPGRQMGSSETVVTGNYDITENNVTDYHFVGWYNNLSDLNCNNTPNHTLPANITVNQNATTEITLCNARNTGNLTVNKNVDTDGDGQVDIYGATDWTWDIAGGEQNVATGSSRTLVTDTYTISEDMKADYHVTDLTCNGVSYGAITSHDVAVTDQGVTCTFTNTRDTGTILVNKEVDADADGIFEGGNAEANALGFVWGIDSETSGRQMGSSETIVTGNYDITENNVTNYHFVGWYNDLSDLNCNSTPNHTLPANITVNQNATTEITLCNARNTGTLIVIKHVINDNGGTAQAGDWTMDVNGPTTLNFAGAESPGTNNTVLTGDYTVTETGGPANYSLSYSGDCDQNGNVTVGYNEIKTCVLTNNDNTAHLTLEKFVTNNNGGTEVPAAWTLSANGPVTLSGNGYADGDVSAGTYTLSESGPSGYTASDWVCVGGTQNGSDITLDLGESATCTITNDDIQPTLTLVKTVINDNGGTLGVSDFPLYIDGQLAISGVANPVTANHQYTATEDEDPGYLASVWGTDCAADGTITLLPGENKTCTITNDDIAPELTVIKHVDNNNGGTAVAADFTMNVTGTNVSDPSFAGNESGVTVTLDQGSYSVDEDFYFGYAKTLGADCSGTINVGETKTCTITNDDIAPPVLDINKSVSPGAALPGEVLTYTIEWRVTGESDAHNVMLTDPIPVNTTFVSADNSGVYDSNTNTVTWNLGTKSPGDSGVFTMVVTVNDLVDAGTVIVNTATIDSTETEPVSDDATATVVAATAPILQITKDVNDASVNPGDIVTYTVVITNVGSASAINVTLTDVLPTNLTFVDGGGNTKTFNLGNLAIGDSVTQTYDVLVSDDSGAGTYTNTATAQADNHPPISAQTDVVVTLPIVLGEETNPDLSITKSVNVAFANPGDTVIYTVTITNNGDGDAINVTLTDQLPSEFTFEGTTDKVKAWELGDISPSGEKTITYMVKIGDNNPAGTYDNLAIAQADNNDEVTAQVPLEVRAIEVLGATLEETGTGWMDYLIYVLGSGLFALGIALFLKKEKHAKAQ